MPTLYHLLEEHKDKKSNKRSFGLVIQGGGMRAAYSAGAILPLIEYGFSNTFDHVLGSSAGAINAAYFVSAKDNILDAYTKELSSKDFVDLLRRDKKIDVDFAVDVVMKQKYPLDIPRIERTHSKLHIMVTDAETGKKVVLSGKGLSGQVYEDLRASAALPILYDKPVLIAGRYYVDGAIADSVPIDVAIKLGCTDIVVILNQQVSSFKFDQRHQRLIKHLIKKFARNYSAALKHKLPTDENLLQVNLRRLTRPHKKVRVYLLEPSNEEILISMTTIDKDKVKEFAKLGVKDMDTFLNKEIINKI